MEQCNVPLWIRLKVLNLWMSVWAIIINRVLMAENLLVSVWSSCPNPKGLSLGVKMGTLFSGDKTLCKEDSIHIWLWFSKVVLLIYCSLVVQMDFCFSGFKKWVAVGWFFAQGSLWEEIIFLKLLLERMKSNKIKVSIIIVAINKFNSQYKVSMFLMFMDRLSWRGQKRLKHLILKSKDWKT